MTDPLFDVQGRVALVTGASSGIGASMARCLVEGGATVCSSRAGKGGSPTWPPSCPAPTRGPATCSDTAAGTALVDGVVADHGRIDILVNNAGTHTIG